MKIQTKITFESGAGTIEREWTVEQVQNEMDSAYSPLVAYMLKNGGKRATVEYEGVTVSLEIER